MPCTNPALYEIVSVQRCIPGRLRMTLAGLRNNPNAAEIVEKLFRELPGVAEAKARPSTGRIVIRYDPEKQSPEKLMQLVCFLQQHSSSAQVSASSETAPMEQTQPDRSRIHADVEPQPYTEWHAMDPGSVLKEWNSSGRAGLSSDEIVRRQARFGCNTILATDSMTIAQIFCKHFFNFTTLMMLSISALPIVFGRIRETSGVLAVLGVNAIIGTYQQQKARKDIRALKENGLFHAKVIRGGRELKIASTELVPGDVIVLEAGTRIPADALLLEGFHLEVDESALTGESLPVSKLPAVVCDRQAPLAERRNMVYMGTFLTRGRARAVVVATGGSTEMGRMTADLGRIENRPSPLQLRLASLAKKMVIFALVVGGAVVAARLMQGYLLSDTIMTGVAIATTAISEGLPIMITVSLVAGMRRMVRHRAVVREMPVLETLAKANVICSDKTGTLTKNEMTVRRMLTVSEAYSFTGDGFVRDGECRRASGERIESASDLGDAEWLLRAAALCNDAVLQKKNEKDWSIEGDPMEAALLAAAHKAGLPSERLIEEWERVGEVPFDSERRRMSVLCRNRQGEYYVFVKGSLDKLLERCSAKHVNGKAEPFTEADKSRLLQQEMRLAGQAMRVIAMGYRKQGAAAKANLSKVHTEEASAEVESDLVFAGLMAMIDPLREDAKDCIDACRQGNIDFVMITGDHPRTAEAIGRDLGLIEGGSGVGVLTGQEMSRMSDEELALATQEVRIFSRTTPGDKQRIIQAFQNRGLIVAMTGDGVNDALALRQSDIGIALGTGTEAAKEAASMVLADDQFSAVIHAIRQGRTILGSIRSTLGYIFTGNISEVVYASLIVFSGLALPLMPLQMTMMNLLTDSLPILVLTLGHPSAHQPRQVHQALLAEKEVLDRSLLNRVVSSGLSIGLTCGAIFLGTNTLTSNVRLAGTIALAVLAISKSFQVLFWRNSTKEADVRVKDPLVLTILGLSMSGLLLAIYYPPFRFLLNSVPLGLHHWLIVAIGVITARSLQAPLHQFMERTRGIGRGMKGTMAAG